MSSTVLVADDSQTIRKIVEMALKAAPFEVVGVGSAQEALKAAQQNPAVILLDYHMPDGSGYEVCQRLKSNGSTANIPIVMLGGSYRNFDEAKAREVGADDVVMKPFKTDELLGAIESVAGASATSQPQSAGGPPASSAPPPTPAGGGPSKPQGQPSKPQGQPSKPQGQPSKPQGQPSKPQGQPSKPQRSQPGGPSQSQGESKPRIRMDNREGSSPRRRPGSGASSKPRMRQSSESKPRIPSSGSQPGGSQPRIPSDNGGRSGSQPRTSGSQPGSQPRASSTPDVNASTREKQVSSGGGGGAAAGAASSSTGDSGVSSVGASRAEIEKMVKDEVKSSVKEQLPSLLRNIMGEVFQQKVLPKLVEHGEKRMQSMVEDKLDDMVRAIVRDEIERLLAEE